MTTIAVSFRDSRFTLKCDDPQHIQVLANVLNEKSADIAAGQPETITDFKILFLLAMELQDQVLNLQRQLTESQGSDSQNNNQVSETISKVADYISDLADKFESKF